MSARMRFAGSQSPHPRPLKKYTLSKMPIPMPKP
jgi:hypothetical protein